jgi:signal transduction histidine kinase
VGKKVLLSVTDTGCGIPAERLETLFDRYRHPEQMDPPPHGLGLGLPLCRCLAERQGGTLLAESRPGQGSRFTLSLPDRQVEGGVSDVPFDYSGGFNRTLLALADALPAQAFLLRSQD